MAPALLTFSPTCKVLKLGLNSPLQLLADNIIADSVITYMKPASSDQSLPQVQTMLHAAELVTRGISNSRSGKTVHTETSNNSAKLENQMQS